MALVIDNRGGQAHLRFDVGETWADSICFEDENENPINLTGYTVTMVVTDNEEGGLVLQTYSSTTGEFIISGVEGKVTAQKFFNVSFCGFYTLKLINPNITVDGNPLTYIPLRGKLHVY
jgi:hypothetical protein